MKNKCNLVFMVEKFGGFSQTEDLKYLFPAGRKGGGLREGRLKGGNWKRKDI